MCMEDLSSSCSLEKQFVVAYCPPELPSYPVHDDWPRTHHKKFKSALFLITLVSG